MSGRAVRGVAVAVVVAALLAGCTATYDRTVWGYKATSSDATTLTLVVGAGYCDQDVKARVVSQSGTEVVVAASARVPSGSCPAALVFREVDVRIAAPIADRRVRDHGGAEVSRRK